MAERIELGFARTVCACSVCVANCKRLSGVCIPQDITRWQEEHGDGFWAWALEHLAASPGSIVMFRGEFMRIPTLVPRRGPQGRGRCHWLNDQDMCDIHETAPFGCAFFTCTMSKRQGDERSTPAHIEILRAWHANGPYAQLWQALHARGKVVEAPEKIRATMNQGRN